MWWLGPELLSRRCSSPPRPRLTQLLLSTGESSWLQTAAGACSSCAHCRTADTRQLLCRRWRLLICHLKSLLADLLLKEQNIEAVMPNVPLKRCGQQHHNKVCCSSLMQQLAAVLQCWYHCSTAPGHWVSRPQNTPSKYTSLGMFPYIHCVHSSSFQHSNKHRPEPAVFLT